MVKKHKIVANFYHVDNVTQETLDRLAHLIEQKNSEIIEMKNEKQHGMIEHKELHTKMMKEEKENNKDDMMQFKMKIKKLEKELDRQNKAHDSEKKELTGSASNRIEECSQLKQYLKSYENNHKKLIENFEEKTRHADYLEVEIIKCFKTIKRCKK